MLPNRIFTRFQLDKLLPLTGHQNQGDVNQIPRTLFYNKQKEPFQTADVALMYPFIHFLLPFLSITRSVGCF